MGQCVSRVDSGPYPFARQYDSESVASSVFGVGVRYSWQGHAESKGAKKKEKNAAGTNGNGKLTRGVATSFGFRRRPASSSRAEDNARRKNKDNNGNGGSTEDLRNEDVLSGRSTPLARARKDTNGQTRSNSRFGSRQTSSKTAKVADVTTAAAAAFQSPHKLGGYNNNAFDQRGSNAYSSLPPLTSQVSPGLTNVPGSAKTVTKQTVILTYQPQQYAVQDTRRPPSGVGNRSSSVTRAYGADRPPGKYTFQSNQLPRPQYPAVRSVDQKAIKQVANANRKIASSTDGWREGAGSAVSTDSGVWTGGEGTTGAGEGSPYSRRRPRNLEMVMKGTHTFHLRELQVTDFDIMDDAVVTGHAVIPLPKFPSTFETEKSPDYETNPVPTYRPPSPLPRTTTVENRRSPMSTLERYRNRSARVISSMMDSKEEEKFVFDRIQPEILLKQNSFIKSPCAPKTISTNSTETSPSCKSEVSQCDISANDTWQGNAAGEALATRSNDDISVSLSVSSCDSEAKPTNQTKEVKKAPEVEFVKKTIIIENNPVQQHPLLMKSINLSQNETYKGPMMASLTSSNYSTTSTCTNQSAELHLTLTLEDAKFDMSVFDISTQSLLDDETSPADSLISSTSNSDSNNDLRIERDAPSMSSSAYQTANTKTELVDGDDGVDGEVLDQIKDRNIADGNNSGSCKSSPESPGTPTHASNSLSLSDGRDFFDDEIADQPALSFRKNKMDSDMNKQLRRSREAIHGSPLVQRNRKLGGKVGVTERTTSLDTLSSLASDDLMMEMTEDLARSVTSLQSVDDFIERLDSSLRSGLNTLDERQLRQELASSKTAVRQWSQLLAQSNMLDQQLAAMATSSTTHSLSASNNSLTNVGASLPVRTARLLQRSRAQTPSDIAGSDGTASPAAPAPANLLQDVVDIKTLLLQLKRVLQEPREEHHSMSSETLDPLLAACAAESPRANGRRPPPASPLHPDASAEMRRQIVFLQSQLEERDRLVKMLQQRMERMEEGLELRADDTCNVATQTDRLRPPMTTPMTISENTGLVSWNDHTMNGRKLPTYAEAQKTRRSITNGNIPVKCTCGARKNGFTNGTEATERTPTSVQLRNNSRVGTKYLQAIGSTERHYIKRDSSVDSKSTRKPLLYSNRSKSIENFHNQIQNNKEAKIITKNIVMDESTMRHHTSYGDLYNGCVSSKESVNGNRHSPSLNGQSTDTDYSSDGGYKSLPSNINCQQITPKRVSGIPRRSLESRFSPKYVKASAI